MWIIINVQCNLYEGKLLWMWGNNNIIYIYGSVRNYIIGKVNNDVKKNKGDLREVRGWNNKWVLYVIKSRWLLP